MASKRFKKVLLIRYVSYLTVVIAFLAVIFEFGPIFSTEAKYTWDQLLRIEHTLDSNILTSDLLQGDNSVPSPSPNQPQQGFGSFLTGSSSKTITPVSTDFGIVIEKINANAKVVANVDPGDERAYTQALTQGVAAATGSTKPGEPGNLYIFSHSTDAPWNIVRYNAVFYLLREMEPGDRVVVFYNGRRYNYIVYDKVVTDPKDVQYLANRYDQPVLTLQTCDPPGTLLNRLIVRAKLEGY